MATNVQGSASSIGMAPAFTGMPGAGAGEGSLPQLTAPQGQGAANPAATNPAATDPNAAATAGGALPFDVNKYAAQGSWLGPLMTVGGGFAAVRGFSKAAAASAAPAVAGAAAVAAKGSGLLKWGGIAAALGGIALTTIGYKAKGVETGTQATEKLAVSAIEQMQQAAITEIGNKDNQITTLQQQLAAAQQGAAQQQQAGATPGATPGGEASQAVGAGLDTTVVPGAGQQQGAPVGSAGQVGATDPATGAPIGSTSPTSAIAPAAAGPWSAQSLVGTSVQLTAGASAAGTPIADPGSYRIEQPVGDATGYATLDEANAAARTSMSTELMGSKFLRWMVVEHEGRFYGAIAKQLGEGVQAPPLTPQVGNVVAWSAMNHVSENGVNGWQAYSWSPAGAQSVAVPYGTSNVFGGGVSGGGPIGTAPAPGTAPTGTTRPTLAGTSIPVPGSAPVTGGGAAAPFDPASQVGRSFAINASNTAEGDLARGGVLQVQKFVESSAGGFGTAEEAATAARTARTSGGGNQWTRWVSMQGADGRFYVYQGSIVKRPTTEVEASPVHVFGVGFAEFFDASTNAWKAVREARAA